MLKYQKGDDTMYCTKCKMTYPDDGTWEVCPECDIKLITNKERDYLREVEKRNNLNVLYDSLRQKYEKNGMKFTKQDFEDYLQSKRLEQYSQYKNATNINNIDTTMDSTPKCPICNSKNLKKITVTNRAVSIAIFGILSTKINKQWHCNDCGTNF